MYSLSPDGETVVPAPRAEQSTMELPIRNASTLTMTFFCSPGSASGL